MNGSHGSYLKSADETFRKIVHEIIITDNRFVGMSRYVQDISFFWATDIETACAGYGFIFFNPDFWDKLCSEKRKTVVGHEIWHLILRHLDRGEGYNQNLYNMAADYVINLALEEEGFLIDENTEFAGINPCFDRNYTGWSTDRIYRNLLKQQKQGSNLGPVEGTPTTEEIKELIKQVLDAADKASSIQEIAEEDMKALNKALNSKLPGTQSGAEARLIEAAKQTVFIQEKSYEEIFESYLTDPLSGGKRTYLRPSRRQSKGGLRLKGKHPKKGKDNRLTHLVYALDVSGSISKKDADTFMTSAKTLKQKLNPELMTVILWDTAIQFEKTYRESENLTGIHVYAGGGTFLDPVYTRVKQLDPEALVIFTDLMVRIPPKPKWETIWFVTDACSQPSLQNVTYGNVYKVPELIK